MLTVLCCVCVCVQDEEITEDMLDSDAKTGLDSPGGGSKGTDGPQSKLVQDIKSRQAEQEALLKLNVCLCVCLRFNMCIMLRFGC